MAAAARSLAATAQARRLATLTIEQVNGGIVFGTDLGRALREAGFVESTRGLTLRRPAPGTTARPLHGAGPGAREDAGRA